VQPQGVRRVPVSFDRLHDGEDIEPTPDRAPRPAPGLDQSTEGQDTPADRGPDTRSRAELSTENASLARAVGELASENADLYKRIDALQADLKASQAETKTEQDKFRAWAKAISNRDAERDLRDEARAKREEALTGRVAELERKDAVRSDTIDSDGTERWLGKHKIAPSENDQHKHRPGRPSNEIIAVGAAWVAFGLSIYSQVKGTSDAASLATYGAEGTTLLAAHIALFRKHGEAGSGDRSQG
jgi:hypothetical protein